MPRQSYSEALAELRDAATAYLRADRDGLSRLVAARDRASALLGETPAGASAGVCDCNAAAIGFHASTCAAVAAVK